MLVHGRKGGRKLFFSPNAREGESQIPQKVKIEQKNLYDYFYDEVLPLAFQYGMSTDEFWHGDMRLLEARQKAYMRDVSYRAWVEGQHTSVAFSTVMANAFAKKGAKKAEYPAWTDPFEKISKKVITKENIEEEFRIQQAQQNAWLKNLGK
jgi:hypothetical protein